MEQLTDRNSPEFFATENESYYFDRKSARKDAREIARHISAFANAAGGKLVIGIEDDGEITGFKRDKARNIDEFRQAAILDCIPSPQIALAELPVINSKGEDDFVLVMNISASPDRVIRRRSDNAVFLRQNDHSPD